MPFVYLVTNCRENILTLSFVASSHFPEAVRLKKKKKQKTREIKNMVRAWVKLNVSQRPTEQGFIQLVTLNNSLQKKTGWVRVCVCVCVEIYIYINFNFIHRCWQVTEKRRETLFNAQRWMYQIIQASQSLRTEKRKGNSHQSKSRLVTCFWGATSEFP